MTLKEKVAEVNPESIDECEPGGVFGCPNDYAYLHANKNACEDICKKGGFSTCNECWGQEYKEV